MASGTTKYEGLNQWAASDLFLMEEFNEDNARTDEALNRRSWVQLGSSAVTAMANSVSVNLTGVDTTRLEEVKICLNGYLNGVGVSMVLLRLNGEEGDAYETYGRQTGTKMSLSNGYIMGYLTGKLNNAAANCTCTAQWNRGAPTLYSKGILRHAGSFKIYDYIGLFRDDNAAETKLNTVTAALLDANQWMEGGTTLTVYGLMRAAD